MWPGHYGLFLAAGFLVAVATAMRRARGRGEDATAVRDLALVLLGGGLVGARVLYALVAGTSLVEALQVWRGGLIYFGGVAGALAAGGLWAHGRRRPLAPLADVLAPSVALGHAVGRLGCFAAGCCWGRPSAAPWAVRFVPASAAFAALVAAGQLTPTALATPPLHPTQLYEAAGELALFAALVHLGRRALRPGRVTAAYLGGYALVRLAVEPFRGDPRGTLLGLSTSQALALVALAVAVALARRFSRV
jgi:phosphatidylglycerol:prolipoprotein diacylglycerol transferase